MLPSAQRLLHCILLAAPRALPSTTLSLSCDAPHLAAPTLFVPPRLLPLKPCFTLSPSPSSLSLLSPPMIPQPLPPSLLSSVPLLPLPRRRPPRPLLLRAHARPQLLTALLCLLPLTVPPPSPHLLTRPPSSLPSAPRLSPRRTRALPPHPRSAQRSLPCPPLHLRRLSRPLSHPSALSALQVMTLTSSV